jgi:hypothetical protein
MIRHCEESLNSDPANRSNLCGIIMSYIEDVSAGIFDYDARIFGYDWNPTEDDFNYFMNNCTQA